MKTLPIIALLTILTLAGCKKEPLRLEYQDASGKIPSTCAKQSETALHKFNSEWVSQLMEPVKISVIDDTQEQHRKFIPMLAPIGSHPIFVDKLMMTNETASLFINCKTREAFIKTRGGYQNITKWYGPIQF